MKRVQRHHLKENELGRVAREMRVTFEGRRREATAAFVLVAVIGAIGLGYLGWRGHVQSRSHALLAEALATQEANVMQPGVPAVAGAYPNERARAEATLAKLKTAADTYPATDAGIFARYQQGSILMTLGNTSEAAIAYQDVMQRAGESGIYGQMAKLGLAEAQARSGQFDQAINTFKDLAQRKDGPLPVDAILMQLGRTYRDSGKRADAEQTFNRLLQEYPASPYNAEAKRELDSLKKA